MHNCSASRTYATPCTVSSNTVIREVFESCACQPQPSADLWWVKLYIISESRVYLTGSMFPKKFCEHAPASASHSQTAILKFIKRYLNISAGYQYIHERCVLSNGLSR